MKWKLTEKANCARASETGSTRSNMDGCCAPPGLSAQVHAAHACLRQTLAGGWRWCRRGGWLRLLLLLLHLLLLHLHELGAGLPVDHLDVEDQYGVGRDRPGRLVPVTEAGLDPHAVLRPARHQRQCLGEGGHDARDLHRRGLLALVEHRAVGPAAL